VGIVADFAQILRTVQSPDTTNAHCCAMRLQRRLFYSTCSYGPLGPAPTFAGADFSNARAVIRNGSLNLTEVKPCDK